ncbi:hypothetical protein BH11VER1_BH11VER1_15160 [soil metagenome]
MVPLLHSLPPDDEGFLQRVADFDELNLLTDITAENLSRISREHGIDFATALLYARFCQSPRHGPFISRIQELINAPPRALGAVKWRVVIVPGALYVERPDLGGDGQLVREAAYELGLRCDLVPLASRGSVQENAARLVAWLEQQTDESLVLVSLSKGGPDIKLALAHPDSARIFRNVSAWINVCGPIDGTPLADWIIESRLRSSVMRLQYSMQRRDFGFITDLRHGLGSPLRNPLRLPDHLRLVSFVGFPLRRHLSTMLSRFSHRVIAPHGPSDGTVPLADLLSWPGNIFPVWGADHYFQPASMSKSLITAALHYLAQDFHAHGAWT